MSGEFNPLLEDPKADLSPTQMKEYGLPEIWAASGDPKRCEELRKKWIASTKAPFRDFVSRAWYWQRRRQPIERRFSPVPGTDEEGMHGRLQEYEDLSGYYERGGLKAIYQAAGLTEVEIETVSMRHSGTEIGTIARMRGVRRQSVQDAIGSANEKLRSRFAPACNPLMGVGVLSNVA